ncbi:hypothetical protein IHE45_04G086000 [Dioscorea alata]|uniref:Uncharacterized protein n=1 Tax=Dioscorea alata TaxID=55571 RepID=A0ACB7WDL4_DIOAL|nr:hypothetical protein IHE45_04G086000 [Dioscorea alata]
MTSFHPSSTLKNTITILYLLLLLLSQSHGYRLRGIGFPITGAQPEAHRRNADMIGRTFNMLPRGVPIPPSGPSKRHNSAIDSINEQGFNSP